MSQNVVEGNDSVTSRIPREIVAFTRSVWDGWNLTKMFTQDDLWNNDSVIINDWQTLAPTNNSLIGCDVNILQYRIVPALIMAACFVFGVFCWLFGYRFIKATMFVTGFVVGTSIVYFFCVEARFLPSAGQIGLAIGAGLLCGILSMLIIYVGLFVTGFSFSATLAIVAFVVVEQFYHPVTRWMPISVTLGVGVVFGILAVVRWQKVCVVAGSSLLGSTLMLCAVDYYVNLFRSSLYSYAVMTITDVDSADNDRMCWFSWLIFAVLPIVFVVGIVIQWCLTVPKVDPTASDKDGATESLTRRRQQRSESMCQQDNYRQLYKIRRANGDVVSKSYMQSIHSHLSPSLRLLTPAPPEIIPADDNNIVMTQTEDTEP